MRVLQVTPMYYPDFEFGGPPVKIHALSLGLQARGHEVRVVTFDAKARLRRGTSDIGGVAVHYLPWAGCGNWRVPLSTARLRECILWANVVQLYGLFNSLCPIADRQAAKAIRPTLLEPEGMFVPLVGKVGAKAVFNRLCTLRMAHRARRLLAASPAEARNLQRLVPEATVVLRPNIVERPEPADPTAVKEFRRRLGLSDDRLLVLFLGRISPVKNLEMLLDAFSVARVPGAFLALVGPCMEPTYKARLTERSRELGLGTQFAFVEALQGKEKVAALVAADLFVLPSVFESFGIAAVEAAFSGTPVLLTENCGVAAALNGRGGMAVPCSVEGLAKGMEQLLRTHGKHDVFRVGLEDVVTDFSVRHVLDITEQVYGEVLAEASTLSET